MALFGLNLNMPHLKGDAKDFANVGAAALDSEGTKRIVGVARVADWGAVLFSFSWLAFKVWSEMRGETVKDPRLRPNRGAPPPPPPVSPSR